MKIDKPNKPSPIKPTGAITSHSSAKGKSSPPSSAPQTNSTNVSLGTTAAQLNSMESSMMNAPIVDTNKVAEIKQAISDGRFKVDSEVVADKLIETARDLISNRT